MRLENPTSEHLAAWLWEHIKDLLPSLTAVTLWETADARCVYRGLLLRCQRGVLRLCGGDLTLQVPELSLQLCPDRGGLLGRNAGVGG